MVSGDANRGERAHRPRLVLAGAVVVVGLLAWWIFGHLLAKKPAAKGPPPIPVAAVAATAHDVPTSSRPSAPSCPWTWST